MKLKGIPVTGGVAIGRVMRYLPDSGADGGHTGDLSLRAEEELARCRRAAAAVREELEQLAQRTSRESRSHADIFYAHVAMLEDAMLNAEIVDCITKEHLGAAEAVDRVFRRFEGVLRHTEEPLIQERAADLDDIRQRMLRQFSGRPRRDLSHLPGPVVVVARGLLPSDTATLDRKNVLAIVTEAGSRTSHSAIIARSYDIPGVVGVTGAMSELKDGETVVVDGGSGTVYARVEEDEMERLCQLRDRLLREKRAAMGTLTAPPVTKDGRRIGVKLNVEALTRDVLDMKDCVDGVGLFRTEFLYMDRWELPSEEEQVETYRRAAEAFAGKPVTLRTLDIGGDKRAGCLDLPREENPFLGNRGLRLCLARKDLFRTQLRAILRASVYGDLRLMLPMVSSVEDIRAAKAVLEEAKEELRRSGQAFREDIPVGIMVEVPSIALTADLAAREVDFASIGSNDLCQYLMAADRKDPEVAAYYRSFHPAMLRLVRMVTEAFHRQGKPVSVCGEMGGDPVSALALLGLGVDGLSMGVSALPGIKKMITCVCLEQVRTRVAELETRCLAQDIEDALQDLLDSAL